MAENISNQNHHYFFRATMLDVATFTVGIQNLSSEVEDDVWQTVRTYVKDHHRLGIPDPYDVFEFSKHVGMVTWEEARVFQKTKYCWSPVATACVSIERIYDTMQTPLYDDSINLALDRPMQGELDFPKHDKAGNI